MNVQNLGPAGVFAWLTNNPANGKKAQFHFEKEPSIQIIGNIPVESLKLPPGYYPNHQGNISNRKNVPDGAPYDNIRYTCDVHFFVNLAYERAQQARRKNNPFFKELHFGSKAKNGK